MRKLPVGILLLVLCITGCKPTLEQLINRHIEASGGLERLRAIQTVRVVQRVETGNPANDFSFVIMRKRGNKFRMEERSSISAVGYEISGCDGRTSWVKGWQRPAKPGLGLCDGAADIDGLLMNYKEKGMSLEFVGREKIDGSDLYHIKLIPKPGGSLHFYIDTHTFLLSRIASESNGEHREDIYSDYRKVDGVMVAFCDQMRWWKVEDKPEQEDKLTALKVGTESPHQKQIVEKIEFNVPLDDSLFAMPSDSASTADAESRRP